MYGGAKTPTPLYLMRHLHGLTQAQLANRARVTRETVSHLESGRQAPHRGTALLLAAALGCSVEALFPFDDDGRPAGEVP